MTTIIKSKSNICNNRTASGIEDGTEVDMEVSVNDGRITVEIIVTFSITGQTERHEFHVEGPPGGTRPALPLKP
jgi:hypothetical protein